MKKQQWWVIQKPDGSIEVDFAGNPWTWATKKEIVKSQRLGPKEKPILVRFVRVKEQGK